MKELEITYDEYINAINRLKDYVSSTDNDDNNDLEFFDHIEPIRICRTMKERDL